MNYSNVASLLGTMSLFAGIIMSVPLVLSFALGDGKSSAIFLCSMFITLIAAYELRRREYKSQTISVKDGIAITGLGWILVSVLGMVPYLLSGFFTPLDAFVESVSGFSGTGATVLLDVEALSPSILLWRSFTNWIGGLGIVVIFMAILPQMGRGAMFMFRAESSGSRQVPRIKDNAVALFSIYVTFTILCIITFFLCGMDPFAAVNYALTTIGTGGFAIHNDGLLVYDNVYLEAAFVFFMILASGSFAMYFAAWQKNLSSALQNTEFRVFLGAIFISSVLIVSDLVLEMDLSFGDALRRGVFHVASIASTTAFVTDDFDTWPAFSKCILLLLMFMGGCAGSTSGGVKVYRVILLVKMIRHTLMQKIHPQVLTGIRMNGKIIPDEILYGVGRFFFAYLLVDIIFATLMIIEGIGIDEAVGVAISTLGSVGPGFGLAGAMSTYALLPPLSKFGACIVMFLGRLEIFTALALFTPEFWKSKKGW